MRRLLLMLTLLATCCARPPGAQVPAPMTVSADRESRTDGGSWIVRWLSRPDPIPLNEPFEALIDVRGAGGGTLPPEDTEVIVNAGMPGHGHGMTVKPSAHRESRDMPTWSAEGLLFHMPGSWELTVTVKRGVASEIARFPVELSFAGLLPSELAFAKLMSPKPPLPKDPTNEVADNPRAAELGQRLFFTPILSTNGKVACASCHEPGKALANAQRFANTLGQTSRHVPTLWNSSFNRWYFWDGRADSAWAQALGPLENPIEHGASRVLYARLVFRDEKLRSAYESLFGPMPDLSDTARFPEDARPDPWHREAPHQLAWLKMSPIDQDAVNRVFSNLGKSLAAYERLLVGGKAPFDTWVEGLRDGDPGKLAALSDSSARGFQLFVGRANCKTCHFSPLFSDSEFHDIRLPPPEGAARDTGRFRGIELVKADPFNGAGAYSADPKSGAEKLQYLAQQPENWGQFKTPSLRNVALTAPYMHDGRFAALADVVHYYATLEGAVPPDAHSEKTLVRVDLSLQEKTDLIAFLESLTEDLPAGELLQPVPEE